MDWQVVLSVLALIVGAVGAYYTRQQVVLLRRQMSPPVNTEVSKFIRLKLYGPIVALVILVLLAWIPHLRNQSDRNVQPMIMWGEVPYHEGAPYRFRTVVDGTSLQTYQSSHSLAVICLHFAGTQDFLDVTGLQTGLQKSALFDIRDSPIDIVFDADETFVKEVKKGIRGTRYILVRVPKGISMDQFSTFRQAFALGVVEVQAVLGPP